MVHHFSLDPFLVRKIPYDKLINMIIFEQEWKKQEQKIQENITASAIAKAFKK
jgi:hypothetical protein